MYADDVQIRKCFPLGLVENAAVEVNEDLANIHSWSEKNGLCLNPVKSKCLVISRKAIDTSYFPEIVLNNKQIEFVESARNLGLMFTKTLSWNYHIRLTIGRIYGGLRLLWTNHKITPLKTRIILAKTLLVPIMLYGCEIFHNCDYEHKRKLNVAYNSIARYIFGLRRYDHVSEFSRSIYGITLESLFKFRSLLLLNNIMQTRQPPYLYDKICHSRSSRSLNLVPLRYTFLISERQFFITAIRMWNCLPRSIRMIYCTKLFELKLKEYLQTLR